MKKNKLYIIIGLVAIFVILIATNPSKEQYVIWLTTERLDDRVDISEIQQLVRERTVDKNYIVFSTYALKVPDGKDAVWIGIFNGFKQLR